MDLPESDKVLSDMIVNGCEAVRAEVSQLPPATQLTIFIHAAVCCIIENSPREGRDAAIESAVGQLVQGVKLFGTKK